MINIEIIQDVTKGELQSAFAFADDIYIHEAKKSLEREGYRIISLEEMAKLRIQEGRNTDISILGNRVREGSIYIPDKGIFLTKKSQIIANAKEVENYYSMFGTSDEWYLTDAEVEEALADSIELKVRSIPTNRFADEPVTVFAFGETAKAYGEFLREMNVDKICFWLNDLKNKPFERPVVLTGRNSLGSHSDIVSNRIHERSRVLYRGVRDNKSK